MVENRTNVRRILVPSQPTYLAWPGYFARLIGADEIALMDDVQFVRQGWQHRNRIWDPAVGQRMLTIPVMKKGRYDQRIDEVQIAAAGWEQKHLRQITQAYPKLRLRGQSGERIQEFYAHSFEWLRDANEAFIDMVIDLLQIDIKVTRSSTLNVTGKKTERLLDMCDKTGCNVMRLGPGALDYLDLSMINEAGVELEILRTASVPPNPDADPDLSRLSIVDTLLRHDTDSRSILEGDYWLEKVVTSPAVEAAGQR
ncbi:WbqC family protein [Kocuria rosea]|uniref:WbqC family protein n=1 Tax=Kocuria rosea TaxID=1275 RepID=UPI000F6F9E58|nr:WbqC family protein [Kocuria rosea]VEI50364.1 WbqC-like protein family [Kocuria rosea]